MRAPSSITAPMAAALLGFGVLTASCGGSSSTGSGGGSSRSGWSIGPGSSSGSSPGASSSYAPMDTSNCPGDLPMPRMRRQTTRRTPASTSLAASRVAASTIRAPLARHCPPRRSAPAARATLPSGVRTPCIRLSAPALRGRALASAPRAAMAVLPLPPRRRTSSRLERVPIARPRDEPCTRCAASPTKRRLARDGVRLTHGAVGA